MNEKIEKKDNGTVLTKEAFDLAIAEMMKEPTEEDIENMKAKAKQDNFIANILAQAVEKKVITKDDFLFHYMTANINGFWAIWPKTLERIEKKAPYLLQTKNDKRK